MRSGVSLENVEAVGDGKRQTRNQKLETRKEKTEIGKRGRVLKSLRRLVLDGQ
jgi:predicted RNA-binding protein Jag